MILNKLSVLACLKTLLNMEAYFLQPRGQSWSGCVLPVISLIFLDCPSSHDSPIYAKLLDSPVRYIKYKLLATLRRVPGSSLHGQTRSLPLSFRCHLFKYRDGDTFRIRLEANIIAALWVGVIRVSGLMSFSSWSSLILCSLWGARGMGVCNRWQLVFNRPTYKMSDSLIGRPTW